MEDVASVVDLTVGGDTVRGSVGDVTAAGVADMSEVGGRWHRGRSARLLHVRHGGRVERDEGGGRPVAGGGVIRERRRSISDFKIFC
jgi:hypothetical protein